MNSGETPTSEDFERARAAMRRRDRGLSEVRSQILKNFGSSNLHQFFVQYSSSHDLFVVYVFYERNDHVDFAEDSGLNLKIKEAVIRELERVGRGSQDSLKIEFRVDSHENVEQNFDGDYYLRLR